MDPTRSDRAQLNPKVPSNKGWQKGHARKERGTPKARNKDSGGKKSRQET